MMLSWLSIAMIWAILVLTHLVHYRLAIKRIVRQAEKVKASQEEKEEYELKRVKRLGLAKIVMALIVDCAFIVFFGGCIFWFHSKPFWFLLLLPLLFFAWVVKNAIRMLIYWTRAHGSERSG